MNDHGSILPLLARNSSSSSRRHKLIQIAVVMRWLTRRKQKLLIFIAITLAIMMMTLLHKLMLDHETHAKRDNQGFRADQHSGHLEPRTMKTIIARFEALTDLSSSATNISDEILNSNRYDPDLSMGKDGRPVYLHGYPKNWIQLLYSINKFNLVVSDKISVDRKLPDARKLACRKKKFNLSALPTTSIIIVFHNEAWSTLARTVHSVLNTSPQHLLAEIILVDDASTREFLGKSLENYMKNLATVRGVDITILRSNSRVGLIRSRLIGVDAAKGQILTFLDAHCETTTGWLEPLLELVQNERKTAVCPIIDIINEDTFAFTRSFELHLGAFNWGLNFRWYPISKRELIAANNSHENSPQRRTKIEMVNQFRSPVMAGGIFSIDKDYFKEIGTYDREMDIWGGENIELSFRLWQCGGQVKIVPCSHVAHVFRKSSPYTFREGKDVGDILYTNLARVAEVWMDEWRDFFYLVNPAVNKTLMKVGRDAALINIADRKLLREKLGCKDFKWFLNNVWPENFFPGQGRFFGQLVSNKTRKCLQRPIIRAGLSRTPVGAVSIGHCARRMSIHQMFVFNYQTGTLMTDENVCLDTGSNPVPTRQVILAPCSESQRQEWSHSDLRLIHRQSGFCLAVDSQERVQLDHCNSTDSALDWTFSDHVWV